MRNVFLSFIVSSVISHAVLAAPPNDDFSNAVQLTGTFDTKSGTNIGATRQSGERSETEYFTTWYKWTAPSTGRARFSVLPTGNAISHTRLSAWYGNNFVDLIYIGSAESSSNEASLSDLPVYAGDDYFFAVGNYTNGSNRPGDFTFSIVLETSSDLSSKNVIALSGENSIFSKATTLTGYNSSAISYGLEAPLRESGEPSINPNYSSWWKWTAPANGTAKVSLAGTEKGKYFYYYANKTLLVYDTESFQEMILSQPIAGTYNLEYGLNRDAEFKVTANNTYYIVSGLTGNNVFNLGWKIMTVQFSKESASASPAILQQISKIKKAIKKAKKKHQKSKVKRLKKKLRQLQRSL